jgi:Bacterial Ig-like domain (group 3)
LLYTAWTFDSAESACFLVEEAVQGADGAEGVPVYNRVAGGNKCGFSGDGGQARGAQISSSIGQIAFDAAGDLYFSDTGNQRVRRIDAATGIIHTIAGTGTAQYSGDGGAATSATLSSPTGVTVDSQGQVYILSNAPVAGPTQVLRKVGQSGSLSFGSQANGSVSSTRTVFVTNTGNADMSLTRQVLNGADAGDFTIDNNTTTCNLGNGSTLASGESCQIGVIFTPKAGGARTANLVLLDNTVLGADTVDLSGVGVLSTPTVKIVSPTAGQTFAAGSSVPFKVSVAGASGVPAPTGSVQFKVDGANQGAAVPLSSGTASVVLSGLKAGSHTLAAAYSGDVNYSAQAAGSESITIKAAAAKVTLDRVSGKAQSCASAAFDVAVTGGGSPKPTGKVELLDDAEVLASGMLVDGKAELRAKSLSESKTTLVAHYGGDEHYLPGNSAPLTLPAGGSCQMK